MYAYSYPHLLLIHAESSLWRAKDQACTSGHPADDWHSVQTYCASYLLTLVCYLTYNLLQSVAAKIDDRAFYIHLAYSAWLTWATYLNGERIFPRQSSPSYEGF